MSISNTQYEQSSTWHEIHSQPEVWSKVLRSLEKSAQLASALEKSAASEKCLFVGCGTSYYLAEAAAFTWTALTGLPSRALPGSEVFLYPETIRAEGAATQAIVISRSGKTSEAVRAADTLRRELKVPTIGITCAQKSELERACELSIILPDADEQSTVMTRSFTSMLISLQFLAAKRSHRPAFIEQLNSVAAGLSPKLPLIAEEIETFVRAHNFIDYVFLGQGAFHGIARESALKVMEMSCSFSQFFHTLEFRHGPKAIVGPETCLTFFLSGTGYQAEAEVLTEMKDLGGRIVVVCDHASDRVKSAADLVVELNLGAPELALLAPYVVPNQLMGFFTGAGKGLNPDSPKNLTRVVMLD